MFRRLDYDAKCIWSPGTQRNGIDSEEFLVFEVARLVETTKSDENGESVLLSSLETSDGYEIWGRVKKRRNEECKERGMRRESQKGHLKS